MRDVRSERGATTVMFAILFTTLIAAVGVGIDSSGLAYHRSRTQHAADAAALAIATDCVRGNACNPAVANTAAEFYAGANAAGGGSNAYSISPGTLSKASGKVTVDITKTVNTKFFSFLGIDTKNVRALATAKWGAAKKGTVIPYLVSLCQYLDKPIGTDTFLAADRNDVAADTLKNKPQSALEPYLQSCNKPSSVTNPGLPTSLRMYNGGLWISTSTSNDVCQGKIDLSVFDVPPDARAANENCTKKYSDDLAAAPDGVALLAIYAPTDNYQFGGVRGPSNNMGSPVKFGLQIVGFAPFKLSGWCLGQPAACGGTSPGKIGLAGKFIKTVEPIPGVEYDPSAPDLGATSVELIE